MGEPTIAVCLIVRDAHDVLTDCLASVRSLADEVVVCDTGSVDGTLAVAARSATTLIELPWRDHFAEARNAALARCTADWVLSIDADETAVVDAVALRDVLAGLPRALDAVTVEIVNAGSSGVAADRHPETKLFRRDRVCWTGRVHERLVLADGTAPDVAALPPELICLRHTGYSDPVIARAKAARNARLGELALSDPVADQAELALVQLDLGRSYYGQQLFGPAETALRSARSLVSSGPVWLWATDFLIRLELSRGEPNVALGHLAELIDAGVPRTYYLWQQALALVVRGDVDHAAAILADVDEVVDVGGLRQNPADLAELRAALAVALV